MLIEYTKSLKSYNSFGIDVSASRFVSVADVSELKEALKLFSVNPLVLGGGNNVLFVSNLEQPVIHINIKGIYVEKETDQHVYIRAGAGEIWHDLVLWTLDHNYGGLENLSLIPSTLGAAPIQNIGAYGVELKDVFYSCKVLEIATGKELHYSLEDCKFGYRESIFKKERKNKDIITEVTLKLSKSTIAAELSYGDIKASFEQKGIKKPSIKEVSDEVVAIRTRKIPSPKILGNVGSFFKNPITDLETLEKLKALYPGVPVFKTSDGGYKISAAWLIEAAGFKGKRFGDAGVYENQALVLVNHGKASGRELLELAQTIQEAVFLKFKIYLEPEVNIFGQ